MPWQEDEGADAAVLEDVHSYQQSEKRAREMQKASLIQAFFDRTSSQLTQHGLHCLHQVPHSPLSSFSPCEALRGSLLANVAN